MHTKILKKILSVLCVAAMSFSTASQIAAIKTGDSSLQPKVLNCNSSIFTCLKSIDRKLNYLNNYKFLKRFDNSDQQQTDTVIKLLNELKHVVGKVNQLCLNDFETLNSIASIINSVNAKINLIELKIHHNDCINTLTTWLNELKRIVDMNSKFEQDFHGKVELNLEDLVEKLNAKTEKILQKIKNIKCSEDIEEKWKELIFILKNTPNLEFNTDFVGSQIKILDDFVENLLTVDLKSAEYYISNFFVSKIQTAIFSVKKLPKVDFVPQKMLPKIKKLPSILKKTGSRVKDREKKVQIIEPNSEKTNPKVEIETLITKKTAPKVKMEAPISKTTDPKVKIKPPISEKIFPKFQKITKRAQGKSDFIRDGEDALKNCDSTLENSMKLFENCDKNYVKQALSFARQLFMTAKQNPTDNEMLTKCVKYWKALNEINVIKSKIINYCKVLQNQSLEEECCDILYSCFENFTNNSEFVFDKIKTINIRLNQAMRPMINQKILSLSNMNVVADSSLQGKWKNEIQAGRQTGLLCWLFAATNARNWFRVQNGESRIYGSKNVCDEYVKNKGNSRDLKSDQDYEPILKYLQNCRLSTYFVTSDIGNSDKDAQQTNRLLSEALLKKHFSANKSAVIVNKPGHWVAIAAIDTQTKKALVVDSLNESPFWTDLSSLCASISNIKDPKNPNCNGLSMIFVKDDQKSSNNSAAFQNENMSDWLNIFDAAIKAAGGEF